MRRSLKRSGQGDALHRYASDGIAAAEHWLSDPHSPPPDHAERWFFVMVAVGLACWGYFFWLVLAS